MIRFCKKNRQLSSYIYSTKYQSECYQIENTKEILKVRLSDFKRFFEAVKHLKVQIRALRMYWDIATVLHDNLNTDVNVLLVRRSLYQRVAWCVRARARKKKIE